MPDSGSQNIPTTNGQIAQGEDSEIPKPKRVACAICRKRKLKCDGGRPKCGTCARLGHNCAYDEVRRKSGPKRGYVKELEARLAQVETQLKTKTQEAPPPLPRESSQSQDQYSYTSPSDNAFPGVSGPSDPMNDVFTVPEPAKNFFGNTSTIGLSNGGSTGPDTLPDILPDLNQASAFEDGMTWEMIGLGLEEPLPTQEAIDELQQIYFESVHPSMPMLHPYRYRASMGLAPHMRPSVSLRYAMWALASKLSDKYHSHHEIFYRRARKYAELDEMKGLGEAFVTVPHCQSWIMICTYEFQMMYFPRAWSSVGRAVRLAMMMGLNRIDGAGLDVKQVLHPPRDWTEAEERRRTFWMGYCIDRYASMGTGWPMAVDERDIKTNLPANEVNYEQSIEEVTHPLSGGITPQSASSLSPFAGTVFMAHIFGRNLTHLHRPTENDNDHDLQGEFWKRHRALDNTLLQTSLSLPPHLRLPAGVRDVNIVFINMSIHTSTICLHQAAIFKADQKNLPQSLVEQSSTRCLLAATEITNIMRLISHLESKGMNPFIAFCLYVAARVFIHVLKKSPDEAEIRSSLEFLLAAMQQFRRINPLSESFLIQLGLDLEGTGMDFLLQNSSHTAISLSTMKRLAVIVSATPTAAARRPFTNTMHRLTHVQNRYENNLGCSHLLEIGGAEKHMHPLYPSPKLPHPPSAQSNPNEASGTGTVEPHTIRATQYSMQNFEIPICANRPALPIGTPSNSGFSLGNLNGPMPPQSPVSCAREDWYQNFHSGKALGLGVFDPDIKRYGEMSSGQNSSSRSPENTSSNTSYSPPSHDGDTGPNRQATATKPPIPIPGAAKCFDFVNGDGMFMQPPTQQQANGDFNPPSKWNFDSAGATPQNGATGLTPGPDGEWSQMLDNMNWDSTLLDASTPQWSTSPGSIK
ncbi:MAG: hypothetical protein Q9223_005594 [Gallowayella weberi]